MKISYVLTLSDESHDLIRASLLSILNEMNKHDELVIVIQGVNYNSLEPIHESNFAENIQTLAFPGKIGAAAAKNAGWKAARNKWIYFVDGDDELLPQSIENLRMTDICPQTGLLYGDYEIREIDGRSRSVSCSVNSGSDGFINPQDLIRDWRVLGCSIYRKTMLLQIGGFSESTPVMEDVELIQRIVLSRWRAQYVAAPLYLWKKRTHSQSLTKTRCQSAHFWWANNAVAKKHMHPIAYFLWRTKFAIAVFMCAVRETIV
jgi:glycosyltransferase involved in cell wall biosynthesis